MKLLDWIGCGVVICGLLLACVLVTVHQRPASHVEPPASIEELQACAVAITGVEMSGMPFTASGVYIADGCVATAKHVVEGAAILYVHDGDKKYGAYAWAADDDSDCAVLRIMHTGNPIARRPTSTMVEVGSPLRLVSNFGGVFDDHVSYGSVAATNIPSLDLEKCFLMTATVAPGCSGGGVFDEAGNLVGITVAYWGGIHDVSLAVSATEVYEVLERLEASVCNWR